MTITTTTCSISDISSMSTSTKQRITLFINPTIVKHARAQAVLEELTLTNLVEKALIKYLPKEIVIKKSEIKVDFDL